MSDKGGVALAAIGIISAGGIGAYLITRKSTVSPPSTPNYVITLTGPASVSEGSQQTYSGTLTLNGSPVSDATVSLSINNGTPATATTDSNGNYSFQVTFTNTGSYTLAVSANGASSSLTVNVTSSAPPPQTCTSCSNCSAGYNCVNGQCVQLIPQSINVPVDFYVPSGYAQYTLMQNFFLPDPVPVSTKNTIIIHSTNVKSCPSGYGNASATDSYEITFTVKGQIVDASGAGVNGINVSANISGGGGWSVDTPNGTMSGTSSPSLESSTGTTDCNGNFSFTVKVTITVKYNHNPYGNGYNSSYYNMGLASVTLTVSSGALPSANTIISFDEYVAAEICNYIYGVIS